MCHKWSGSGANFSLLKSRRRPGTPEFNKPPAGLAAAPVAFVVAAVVLAAVELEGAAVALVAVASPVAEASEASAVVPFVAAPAPPAAAWEASVAAPVAAA